jgi:molecular chaperone GrpE
MTKETNKKQKKTLKVEDLEAKIQELALAIDRVEDEKLEIQNQLKKALADYHNLVKNSEKREELKFFQTKKNLCEEIIPSLDAVMIAQKGAKDIKLDEKDKSWFEGVLALLEGINRSLESIGLKQYIPNKGDDFDSNIHEALAMVDEGEKGKIFDVVQPGYTLNDTVIRPSRVVVSK